MSFVVTGLPVESFQPLFELDDEALAARHIVRMTAVAGQRFPCRVTLEDAAPGDTVLLLNWEHQPAATPYRSNHAIFVNTAARQTGRTTGELPPVLRGRPIALRAYDQSGMMIDAALALNDDVREAALTLLENPLAAYLHAHNLARGCFAARIDRAQ